MHVCYVYLYNNESIAEFCNLIPFFKKIRYATGIAAIVSSCKYITSEIRRLERLIQLDPIQSIINSIIKCIVGQLSVADSAPVHSTSSLVFTTQAQPFHSWFIYLITSFRGATFPNLERALVRLINIIYSTILRTLTSQMFYSFILESLNDFDVLSISEFFLYSNK